MRLFSRSHFYKYSFLPLLLTALVSCQQTPQNVVVEPIPDTSRDSEASGEQSQTEEPSASANKQPTDKPAKGNVETTQPIAAALAPGNYCYEIDNEVRNVQVRLAVDSAERVMGNATGVIHDDKQGYYTSYQQTLDGIVDGSNLNLDVETWIEYDRQNRQETWRVSPTELTIRNSQLTKANCEEVNKAFQNKDGLEAKDLTANANNVRTREVFFESGKSGTTVGNSVVRADRDVYVLTAQGGQKMSLSISSLEDNAVFDVVAPSGLILGTEQTEEIVHLPNTGDYQIIVGGTRGNATYELDISIE